MSNSGTGSRRRIVITGTGVVSPIGVGRDPFWNALREQRSGVRPVDSLAGTEMPVRFGGQIKDFEPKLYVKPRKSLKVMSREIQTGFAAAELAMKDAGLTEGQLDVDRFGVVYGCQMLYCEIEELEEVYRSCIANGEFVYDDWGKRAMTDMFPLWMLKFLPNMVACHIGIRHDARGPNNTITLGDASSLQAVIEASRVIERGHADVMIAGGSGSRLALTPMMYLQDLRLSHFDGDPWHASRPFDADRDGIVNGEGAGAFIVESLHHARARQANIMAEIVGGGTSFEPPKAGTPRTSGGVQRAITRALEDAELSVESVDHVNAHGLSTVEDDLIEATAIAKTLGNVPVTAPKSFFGNLGAGSGAVEMAASAIGLSLGEVPATLNYQTPDPRCPVQVIHEDVKPVEREAAVVLNHSSTGQTVAVALRRV
jgi:3-oxoacyl-[acyl-carrier-protein] synthase II